MHFNKILLLLITSVFTTLSSAAAIEPKVQNIFVRLDNGCPGGFTKRDLEGRAPPSANYFSVGVGSFGSSLGNSQGLWTEGLVTCIGVAITFEGIVGIQYKFLAHLTASVNTLGYEFNAFEAAIKKSGEKFEKLRCVVSPPNLNGPKPVVQLGLSWGSADIENVEKSLTIIKDLASALCSNGAVQYEEHNMDPPASMQIDPDNTIKVNG